MRKFSARKWCTCVMLLWDLAGLTLECSPICFQIEGGRVALIRSMWPFVCKVSGAVPNASYGIHVC